MNISKFVQKPFMVDFLKLDLSKDKEGHPILTCDMEALDDIMKGYIFSYEQLLTNKQEIHQANEFLRSLKSGIEIEFNNYKQYSNLIQSIHEKIKGNPRVANFNIMISKCLEHKFLN